jgi:hypothetical protein
MDKDGSASIYTMSPLSGHSLTGRSLSGQNLVPLTGQISV